jgi:hypothetical protein
VCRLDSSGLGQGTVAGFRESDNEPSDSTKDCENLEKLNDCYILKKGSVLRSEIHMKIILLSTPRIYKRFLPVSFTNENFVCISCLPYAFYLSRQPHSPWEAEKCKLRSSSHKNHAFLIQKCSFTSCLLSARERLCRQILWFPGLENWRLSE